MAKINLLLGIHNHQPVGNFDGVFKEAYEKCYLSFISALERHPKIRLSLHYTGPLWEWIEWNYPDFFKKINALVERNQIELLTGGFYEPILPIIPEIDAIGQIKMHSRFIKERFGYNPTGLWLAERVWDPSLPKLLSASDIKYTILDESHFTYAGLSHKDIYGYYLTERENSVTAIFPIDKTLRYYIPFKLPEETIDYLKRMAEEKGEIGVTYADDGEKFGVWPGTYKWVFEEGWLEKFFTALEENSAWINLMTFSEFLNKYPPTGRVYLPTASYEEMMEWALPAEAIEQYEIMVDALKATDMWEDYKPFIRGGFWDNFLAKYPEANDMHKKMLYVSNKVNAIFKANDTKGETAKKELYRAQCNCAYWHGLFGGLYLNYLRHAVYKHLILAEAAADDKRNKGKESWLSAEAIDYNADGRKEILISNPYINVYIAPDYGGAMVELDFRPKAFNLSNLLARRKEGYHHKLKKVKNNTEDAAEPVSIHHIVKSKEEGIERFLFYDRYNRYSFLDHFIDSSTTPESFSRGDYKELGDFIDLPYTIEEFSFFKNKTAGYVILRRDGGIYNDTIARPITIRKRFSFNGNSGMINCNYSLINRGNAQIETLFGIEFNLTLLAGRDESRYYILQDREDEKRLMEAAGDFNDVDKIGLRDKWSGIEVDISYSEKSRLWVYPVETVSQSEDGFERTYQGTAFLPIWRLNLKPQEEWDMNISLNVKGG
ncbi:MAG: alpha-amylase/4-alpha-glucanotransferase domain-containing protein [Nitrospirota bacterium]